MPPLCSPIACVLYVHEPVRAGIRLCASCAAALSIFAASPPLEGGEGSEGIVEVEGEGEALGSKAHAEGDDDASLDPAAEAAKEAEMAKDQAEKREFELRLREREKAATKKACTCLASKRTRRKIDARHAQA